MNKQRKHDTQDSGQSLVFVAFLIVALLGFLALVTDVGYMYYTKRDLQGTVDAAVMAGARKTPVPVDTPSEKETKVYEAIHEALGCYARNMGLSASSVPAGPYGLNPGWDGGQSTNYKYSTNIGGDLVTVTVFYQDSVTIDQDIAPDLCVRVDAVRDTAMFFADILGLQSMDVPASAAGYHGIFKISWTFRNYGQDVHATPLYYVDPHAGNREVVYIGCRDGYLYCLNARGFEDGSKKTWAYWRYRFAYDGGGTTSGYTLESSSTSEVARWPMVQGQVRILDRGGRTLLYVVTVPASGGTKKGYLYCFDGSTGQKMWAQNIQAPYYHAGVYGMSYVDSRPNFSSDNEVVYVGSRAGYLYAFDTDTGVPVNDGAWNSGRVQLFGGTISNPWVEARSDPDAASHGLDGRSDIVYMACSRPKSSGSGGYAKNGMVYAFYSDGTVKWANRLNPFDNDGFDGSPTIFGDTLYIGGRDGKLYAVDKETGGIKWSYTSNNPISSTPVVEEVAGNRYVYFASEKATAYKLKDEGTSNTLVWSVALGLKDPSPNAKAAWHSSPALAEDYVYFGCQTRSGSVYGDGGRGYFEALTKDQGQSNQQYKLDADLHSNMEVATSNWIYFGGCDNIIYGVDLNPAKQESKLLW